MVARACAQLCRPIPYADVKCSGCCVHVGGSDGRGRGRELSIPQLLYVDVLSLFKDRSPPAKAQGTLPEC